MKKIYFLIPLVLVILACGAQTALPTAPTAKVETPNAVTNTVINVISPMAQSTNEPKTALVCLAAETVRLRSGPGTSYDELELLSAGDKMTLLDTIAESEDGGLWSKVKIGGRDGWINSRYICGSE